MHMVIEISFAHALICRINITLSPDIGFGITIHARANKSSPVNPLKQTIVHIVELCKSPKLVGHLQSKICLNEKFCVGSCTRYSLGRGYA